MFTNHHLTNKEKDRGTRLNTVQYLKMYDPLLFLPVYPRNS